MDVKILTVNYNTPELIENLIKSYYDFNYDKYQLIIIDGSDKEEYIYKSKILSEKYKDVVFDFIGFNIHHGPGLHYGMKKYNSDYFLLIDSDSYFKKEGYIEYCLSKIRNYYGIGSVFKLDYNGYNISKRYNNLNDDFFIYLHPNGCFINYKLYLEYNPLIKHGSPFIESMISLKEKKSSELLFNDDLLNEYIFIGWNGTCGKFGYNLDK